MTVALDVGSHSFRSLRLVGDVLRARQARAAYCPLPDTATHRRLLQNTGTPFIECDESLIVPGDGGIEIAQALERSPHSVLPCGQLPTGDALSRQMINVLLEALLPFPGEACPVCSVVLPTRMSQDDESAKFLSRLVRLRGYTPCVVSPGLALALAELAPEQFSGVSVVIGHSGTQVVVAHLGREISRSSSSRGGQWLDEQLARDQVIVEKETLSTALTAPRSREDKSLSRLCRELAWEVANEIVATLAKHPLPAPLTVVCGGGVARLPGFAELVGEALTRREPRLAVHSARPGNVSPYSIAHGALIHAELESSAVHRKSA